MFRTPCGHPVRALGTYQGPTGESVRRLKYQDETIWAAYLGSAMQHLLPSEWLGAVLVPVPLHPERLAERGFNQAALLARMLGRRSKLAVAHDWVARTRNTHAQARLGKSARAENLKQGFHCRDLGSQPRVIIVDDVVTTGHTIDACAQVLAHSGADVLGALSCAVARELAQTQR